MSRGEPTSEDRTTARRFLFSAAVWLAVCLVCVKAYHLGLPRLTHIPGLPAGSRFDALQDYLRSLTAISYADVILTALAWAACRSLLWIAGTHRWAVRLVLSVFTLCAAVSCLYAVASVVAFDILGGFLTYPLLQLVGNVRMLSSSVSAYMTMRVVIGLVCAPLIYAGVIAISARLIPRLGPRWLAPGLTGLLLLLWIGTGQYVYSTDWATHYDWRVAENPHWVLVSSWWDAVRGDGNVRLADRFLEDDLADFQAVSERSPANAVVLRRLTSRTRGGKPATPPNVILIVLESVAARWTSVSGGSYDTTPFLKAESAHSLVFDNVYAHVGRSSNSLAAMLLSVYPRLNFHDFTEEYPHTTRTSLAQIFHARGYRTAFVTPSDLSWAGWDTFLKSRGFDDIRDHHDLTCSAPVSSWGVEDRCMVDGLLEFMGGDRSRPFFAMGWSQQTHHPYEPAPGVPMLNLLREPVPDAYDLGRYLNVLHETDRHLGRLFEAVRRAGLADNTLIVVVGDHGQAFGYPHDSYLQGRTVYEEDVHVPLMMWFPRLYRSAARSAVIGGQVDLAPTIAELAGTPIAADWQGRSLFDTKRAPRAYFYVAQDEFKLGVREGNWKYIFDLRAGAEELYDLDRDPTEQHNLSSAHPDRCARLRQRLAAWTDANRRQFESRQAVLDNRAPLQHN